MAKFPRVEVNAIFARDELNRSNRAKGLEFLAQAGDGPIARELREAVQKRGRQPFGAKHLWWEIGSDNDEMRSAGMSSKARYSALALKYHMNDEARLKTSIAKYERAAAEIAAINEENR